MNVLTIEVAYDGPAALRRDLDAQLRLGGFFAALALPPDLPPLAEVTLALRLPGRPPITAPARVTVANPSAMCLEIGAGARTGLVAALEAACAGATAAPTDAGRQVRVATDGTPAADVSPAPTGAGEAGAARPARGGTTDAALPLERRIAAMSIAERVQTAVHGDADARMILLRDRNPGVQAALVRNPKLGLEEILTLARSSQIAVEVAEALANHPNWAKTPQVALALVRNPKTPLPLIEGLLGRLQSNDLRQIAKGIGVRAQVAQVARKRVVG